MDIFITGMIIVLAVVLASYIMQYAYARWQLWKTIKAHFIGGKK